MRPNVDSKRERDLRWAALILGAAIAAFAWPRAAGAQESEGQKAFLAQKCNNCHSVKSAGVEVVKGEDEPAEAGEEADAGGEKRDPPDLSNVGSEKDKVWIAKYLLKQESLEDRKHKKRFRGSKEELKAVSEWLATLKKP